MAAWIRSLSLREGVSYLGRPHNEVWIYSLFFSSPLVWECPLEALSSSYKRVICSNTIQTTYVRFANSFSKRKHISVAPVFYFCKWPSSYSTKKKKDASPCSKPFVRTSDLQLRRPDGIPLPPFLLLHSPFLLQDEGGWVLENFFLPLPPWTHFEHECSMLLQKKIWLLPSEFPFSICGSHIRKNRGCQWKPQRKKWTLFIRFFMGNLGEWYDKCTDPVWGVGWKYSFFPSE